MSETQCAADCAADDDLRAIVDSHGRRIDNLEDDVGTLRSGQDAAMERLISIEAQGQERERNRAAEARDTRNAINGLTQQIAEQTGAQKRQNELKEAELLKAQLRGERIKYWAAVTGIVAAVGGMIGGTLLSSQTWDDFFFASVPFLHHHHAGMLP
ncbi:hypothetical protein CFR78_13765 [Komagataeibacter rhaeticus]|uniref:Uncharacterized protein n=1 Tax=Komagataeibacter rhaeticus TaxID=215221 RepID=A0A181CAJ7_9PROT|nr:hypothetical protein [Komagataeibacter rhaeticus]ATU72900.1 hypothetical protein CT154_08650 [Komagataeibacter xylinus]EGG76641.1 hypothetical protein SXCC_02566 [Gluconacetobacter sp. SXCC-1]KDU95996.1 hypothetical protein GLUCORHAEAF1_05160 [Komagataeibacter rhaeticus AF1]PYD52580.1 hypothetical protein CFR78_13765 [Komagataeibacter rhaeticus]QIP35353.1 hypothetical protein GWK63_07640 [Komagataeibacter rhaeticus]